jgi:hypothetical protein
MKNLLFSRHLLIGAATCLLTAQAIAETLLPRAVSATDTNAYVQASLARVRATPDRDAETLAQVVTNTPVKLLAVREDWCELEVASKNIPPQPEQKAQNIHGFIACRLLAAEPLTLAMTGAQMSAMIGEQISSGRLDAKEWLNWQSRAFWIAPSLTQWAAVGTTLERLYINEAMRYKELEAMRPMRFKVQEFEAMKQRLAAGITVTPESYQEMRRQMLQHTQPPQYTQHQRVKFPEIKPSHFRKHEIPAMLSTAEFAQSIKSFGNMMTLVDALSAYNGASFHANVISPAIYALRPDEPLMADDFGGTFVKVDHAMNVILGIWDVGGLRVTFNDDALLYGITANGEPTATNLKAVRLCMGDNLDENSSSCDNHYTSEDPSEWINKNSVAGYASATPALVHWAGKPMPGGATARAQIKTRSFPGMNENDTITLNEIDLNRDGVADLLILQGYADPIETGIGRWEAVFANIDGQWQLLLLSEQPDGPC